MIQWIKLQPWMTNMIAGTQALREATSVDVNIYLLEQCFDYSLGVVASLGYFMEHDHWFLGANFNWLSASSNRRYDETGALYLLFGFVEGELWDNISPFTAINYEAHIDIYDMTVFLSRGSYHSRSFSYEPFAGVKVLWYNGGQKNIAYGGADPYFGGSTSDYVIQDRSFTAWGAGPEFGFNGEYHLGCNLSVFSDSSIAILYGQLNSTIINVSNYASQLNTAGTFSYNFTYNQPYFIPIRSILGLKLGKYCLEDCHYIAVKVGYDARYILVDTGNNAHNDGAGNMLMGPNPGYNIASNGLYVDFIWDF